MRTIQESKERNLNEYSGKIRFRGNDHLNGNNNN